MNAGKNHLDLGDPTNAIVVYTRARALVPNDIDVHLNLANALLAAGAAEEAIREADAVLQLSPNSAAAFFVLGSAHLRLGRAEDAVKAFENTRRIDQGETATCFQLGKARMDLQQWTEAIAAFCEGIAMDPNHLHVAAHHLLGQALLRTGKTDEAREILERHQASVDAGGRAEGIATFERCTYTQPRVPFVLEQPSLDGLPITFSDDTQATLGPAASSYSGPVGILDLDHSGWNSLFALEPGKGFRVLQNSGGTFTPSATVLPADPAIPYTTTLVGDLQNDRFDDVVVLGPRGCRLFRFSTNGVVEDVSRESQLSSVHARDGALVDLDFTGKLDLLLVTADTGSLEIHRQNGPLLFTRVTRNTGLPDTLQGVDSVLIEDWNRDGNNDVLVSRPGSQPRLWEKQRGGPLVSRELPSWPSGTRIASGDFDNDLQPDLVIANSRQLSLQLNGGATRAIATGNFSELRQILAVDYDNDGWLDIWAAGGTLRAWRNRGLEGFIEETSRLGLNRLSFGPVASMHFADFDRDCDSDVVLALAEGGLRYLRNNGAHAHAQVKVQLQGNRSNSSGIGCRVEIRSGGLRVVRTVQRLPVEIGMGKYQTLDSFIVHWFNWPQGGADLPVQCQEPLLASEAFLQEGSCPYLYAWDGQGFRFVTDILGAAPIGLPLTEQRRIEADPEEWVWVGNETNFPPHHGALHLRITEELREVLYLDEASLAVVDHEPGVEVHATDKLLPGGPFPRGMLKSLHRERRLRKAESTEGLDVTESLRTIDGRRSSPPRLRIPQLRGLAEPHGWILDFGPLEVDRPWVLVLNGWLRFGGGMANVAASHDPSLPFPFPILEAETVPNQWERVDVVVGAPAGKTKTILVELRGKLLAGTGRLRLTSAFEIHWDRIALMEEKLDAPPRVTLVKPQVADLHFRGFSPLKDLAADWPATPDYDRVRPDSFWTIIPGGWCTRYGDVRELITSRDEALALINSGDELSLEFAVDALPPKPAGFQRDYFLYVDGWDKDSDFHVTAGARVEPLPYHGMDDQRYGRDPRPPFPSDALHRKYNTRWVDSRAVQPLARH